MPADIIIDEEKLNEASMKLSNISSDMNSLKDKIASLINELELGYDTDSGKKFIKLCKDGLLSPMNDQAAVLEIMSENLKNSKNEYKEIFDEYRKLNTTIKNL